MSEAAASNVVDMPEAAVAPWTIKGVSPEARNAAIAAAKRAGMTQGEWLTRNIPLMVQAERAGNRLPARVEEKEVPTVAKTSMTDVMMAVEAAERLSAMTSKSVPRSITRLIERQVRANLGA